MTKPTIDDLRRSAKFCGKEVEKCYDSKSASHYIRIFRYESDLNGGEWNPPENAEQDRELRDAIHVAGWTVATTCDGGEISRPSIRWRDTIQIDCHPNDFLTLAASKLEEMKDV